jgi:hypothetical protein
VNALFWKLLGRKSPEEIKGAQNLYFLLKLVYFNGCNKPTWINEETVESDRPLEVPGCRLYEGEMVMVIQTL